MRESGGGRSTPYPKATNVGPGGSAALLADLQLVEPAVEAAVAQQLLSKGADVVVSARTEEKLEQAMSSLIGKISGYVLDVTDSASIQRFFKNVGAFDHLVTPAASSMFAPIKAMDFDAARLMIETKQWGQMSCVFASK